MLTKNGAALLINITNDAWYGTTAGPYQHFSMVVLRAVENRRALARAADAGMSGFIDPAGRVLDPTPLMQEAAVTRALPMLATETIYMRFGDVFAFICLAIALVGAGWGMVRLETKTEFKSDPIAKLFFSFLFWFLRNAPLGSASAWAAAKETQASPTPPGFR